MNETLNLPEFTDGDKVESSFHNFEENPEISGKLMEINEGAYGKQYNILTREGQMKVGTYDVLSTKIGDKAIGKFIKIKYLGEQTSPKTKRKYRDFDVWIKS